MHASYKRWSVQLSRVVCLPALIMMRMKRVLAFLVLVVATGCQPHGQYHGAVMTPPEEDGWKSSATRAEKGSGSFCRNGPKGASHKMNLTPFPPYVVTDYGAAGDGRTKDTAAIQGAIDAAGRQNGACVYFPRGTYLTGTLFLRSGVTIRLGSGAIVLGSTNLADYPRVVPAFRSYTDNYATQSLFYAETIENAAIIGEGTIDGAGAAFTSRSYRDRPFVIRFITCRNIRVEGITLRNAAMWMQHYLACEQVTLRGLTVDNRCNHENDGMDIDSCRSVRVFDCDIRSNDDALVFKSSSKKACEDATVTNCILSSRCNAIKMGTESSGGFRRISIKNCNVRDTRLAGIALEIVDGGTLDGISLSDVEMQNVGTPIFLRLGNRARPPTQDDDKPDIGTFRNVTITRIKAVGAGITGSSITGLPDHPIENVRLTDIDLTYAGGGSREDASRTLPELPDRYPESTMFGRLPAHGLYCRHVSGLTLDRWRVRLASPDQRPPLVCEDVRERAPASGPSK